MPICIELNILAIETRASITTANHKLPIPNIAKIYNANFIKDENAMLIILIFLAFFERTISLLILNKPFF